MESQPADFAVNLRRLLNWHHASSKEAALVIGASEHSLSGWLTGKREPGGKYLRRIGELYEVNPTRMFGDPREFGRDVADPERYDRAEANLAAALTETA